MSNNLSNGNSSEEEAIEVSVANLDRVLAILLYSIVPLTLERTYQKGPRSLKAHFYNPGLQVSQGPVL
jgi:hypothetical protein